MEVIHWVRHNQKVCTTVKRTRETEYNTLGIGNRWRIWESSNLGNLFYGDFGILGDGGCDQARSRIGYSIQ